MQASKRKRNRILLQANRRWANVDAGYYHYRRCRSVTDDALLLPGYDEHEFTASVTKAGGMVHASDFIYNLVVFSQLPPYNATAVDARRGVGSARPCRGR